MGSQVVHNLVSMHHSGNQNGMDHIPMLRN
jgi:hypothetical protein